MRAVVVAGASMSLLFLAGCAGEDTGGEVGSGGTAPLRAGVTTTVAAGSAPGVTLVATLTGVAEAPGPGDTDGAGSASVTISADGKVCATLKVSGIDEPTASHIHAGAAGIAGRIVVALPTPKGGSAEGCVTASVAQAAAILAAPGDYYVNVHTPAFPNGAVRGQLAKA